MTTFDVAMIKRNNINRPTQTLLYLFLEFEASSVKNQRRIQTAEILHCYVLI